MRAFQQPAKRVTRCAGANPPSHEQLEEEHPQRPQVNCTVVTARPRHHLRGQVLGCAAEREACRVGRRGVNGPPEVSKAHAAALAQQKVLGLDVAVVDVALVHVGDGRGHVAHKEARLRFAHTPACLGHGLVKLAAGQELED